MFGILPLQNMLEKRYVLPEYLPDQVTKQLYILQINYFYFQGHTKVNSRSNKNVAYYASNCTRFIYIWLWGLLETFSGLFHVCPLFLAMYDVPECIYLQVNRFYKCFHQQSALPHSHSPPSYSTSTLRCFLSQVQISAPGPLSQSHH